MIWSLARSVGAVLAGLLVALFLIIVVELVTLTFHPFPADVDPHDIDVTRKVHVARFPDWVLAIASAGWGLTTFVSAWLATRLGSGRHCADGILVGSILSVLAVVNMSMLPYPIWFLAANLVAFPLGSYWGARLGGSR